ncbi:MAG TPA: DUF2007 domain-containing protein [Thermohalobaculum sp.]|nr:DUF2007 domain-containing protein [Thermohalobaculum sp.]
MRVPLDLARLMAYLWSAMEELLRTTDPTLVPYAKALLDAEDIECFVFDVNMSILEGSIGILPRRVMVLREDLYRARAILRDNGVEPFEGETWI